jgi:tripartite ATP-independent transporter DctM subunit
MGLFLGSFGAFLVIGVPVALALGLASAAYLLLTGNADLMLAFPQRMIAGVDQFVLMTIPLFLLAGNLMNVGGITDRIVRFSRAIVGHVRGGLSLVTVVASMLFAGVSGAATAEASALGSVLIPAMTREGYGRAYSSALVAVASCMGPIIPPSITMIIYGVLSGTSIGQLFLAGVVPGVMLGVGLMGYCYFVARRLDLPVTPAATFREKVMTTTQASPALMLPIIILGGILTGVFTPTESAAVAAIYALFVSMVLYRSLRWRELWKPFTDTAITTAGIMFIVAMASMVSFVFGFESMPRKIATVLFSISDDPVILLLLVNLILLVLGCFLEPISILILTMPVLIAVAKLIGIDLIHFGMIVVLNVVLGMITPPVGLCLFICCGIGRVSLEEISRAALPMLLICLVVLMLVTFVPQLSLFLPSLFEVA